MDNSELTRKHPLAHRDFVLYLFSFCARRMMECPPREARSAYGCFFCGGVIAPGGLYYRDGRQTAHRDCAVQFGALTQG
jgi:hypothetical protein